MVQYAVKTHYMNLMYQQLLCNCVTMHKSCIYCEHEEMIVLMFYSFFMF